MSVEILLGVKELESDKTSKSPVRFAEKKGTFTKSPPSVAFNSAIGATTPLARNESLCVVCSMTYGVKISGMIKSLLKTPMFLRNKFTVWA